MNTLDQRFDERLDSAFDTKLDELIDVLQFSGVRLEAPPGQGGASTVGPAARNKLKGILKHYAKQTHPFSQCVRDQVKHGLSESHAKGRCGTLKDIIWGTTKWRGKDNPKGVGPHAYASMSECPIEMDEETGRLVDMLGELELWDLLGLVLAEGETEIAGGQVQLKDYPISDRKKMARKGEALPDLSFPIKDVQDVKNAVQAHGRSKKGPKRKMVKAHIVKRAKAIGATQHVPNEWMADESIVNMAISYSPQDAYGSPLDAGEQDLLRSLQSAAKVELQTAAGYLTNDDGTHPECAAFLRDVMSQRSREITRINSLLTRNRDTYV